MISKPSSFPPHWKGEGFFVQFKGHVNFLFYSSLDGAIADRAGPEQVGLGG